MPVEQLGKPGLARFAGDASSGSDPQTVLVAWGLHLGLHVACDVVEELPFHGSCLGGTERCWPLALQESPQGYNVPRVVPLFDVGVSSWRVVPLSLVLIVQRRAGIISVEMR